MLNLIRKLFLVREIKSKTGELHFERWRILNVWLFAIYIHKIYRSDEDIHPHSHPWWFFSKILTGGYIESRGRHGNLMSPGEWTIMGPEEFHRIKVIKPVTSLIITGPRLHEWGYRVNDEFIESQQYRANKRAGMYR